MINHYLDKVLLPKLKSFGVSTDFCSYTIQTIERQMTSLVAHWDDVAFRKSVLLIGMEEGLYYEPSAKTDIKAFIVVTVRNSPIETMQSDFYAEAGLTKPLTNEQVKMITSEAIGYFNTQKFSFSNHLLKTADLSQDYYCQILNDHPVTKTALEKLSTTKSKSVIYKPVEFKSPYHLSGLNVYSKTETTEDKMQSVVFDGYSAEIGPGLCQILATLANEKQSALISDSFKFVTRNFEKLIKILEFLLTHNVCFVTPNFYIENGCVEQRTNLLKASHNVSELEKKIVQTAGLSYKHKTALKQFVF